MRFVLIALMLVLCGLVSAYSQMYVVSTTPFNAATGVALTTTISFAFSEPLDTSARWNESHAPLAILIEDPRDSIAHGALTYSADLRTVRTAVTLTANTDICWVITNARSQTGDSMADPFVLEFTTAGTRGARAITGTTSCPGHSPVGVIVALLAQPPEFNGHREARLATVVSNSSGSFGLYGVRPGTYWLAAGLDVNQNGELDDSEPQGEYDQNSDGQADSVVVTTTDIVGIVFPLNTLAVPGNASALPQNVALSQNFPNPFNPTTEIEFSLPRAEVVRLAVFDVLGREVAALAEGRMSAGVHIRQFDGATLPAGIYFYRLNAGAASITRKMMLLK
jgi:hypothetical protein